MLDEIRNKLEAEVERLLNELNVVLPAAIRRAVELGDLRENADYKSALERQQFVQARLGHLTSRLGELSRIDIREIPADRVGFGSRLLVRNVETDEEFRYTIVAGDFMDLEAGHISMASPLGRAFLGARAGEQVEVELPAGQRRFAIIELLTLPQAMERDSAA
ncbi:MAG: GreA/GreB family elongation factor [Longimicrobiales bacterium]